MGDLSELFKILSNTKRLQMLFILKESKKLSDIAKELRMPSPEVARNLKILHNADLIIKEEDKYKISNLANLIIENPLSFLEFIWKYKDIFADHILPLPKEFIYRLGEVGELQIIRGTIDGFNLSMRRFEKTQYYHFATAEKILEGFVRSFVELLKRGVNVRLVVSTKAIDELYRVSEEYSEIKNTRLKVRVRDEIPVTVLVDENSAEINIPFVNGKMDYGITFYSENEKYRKFAKDLFYYLWSDAKEIKI